MADVVLSEVSKAFRGRPVLDSVSIQVERGKAYGITGPNGAGKSVILKLMCGLMKPDSGSVSFDPAYVPGGRTFPDRFGVSINGPAYLAGLTAEQNLRDLARIRNRIGDEQIAAAMDRVGLERGLRTKARSFSMGMKQKLSLAQALMEGPTVLILDEPFNALDESSRARVTTALREHVEAGGTLVFTSHHQQEVAELADATYAVDERRLKLIG